MSLNTKKVIFIIGPTAIGKTSLSIDIAKTLDTEIISCDSRQFYKELLIGAAPPNKDQLKQVKHHFIQTKSVTEKYNAGKFEIDAIEKISSIHKKKNNIIAVGGSGLYIDSICKGFDNIPQVSQNTRQQIDGKIQRKGLEWLQNKVKEIDPEFYINCDKNNSQRLSRALEVYTETNKKISSFRTRTSKYRMFEIVKIGLHCEREILYNKINKRVDKMLEKGLLKEVYDLMPYQNLNALQTVGYKELFAFYNNKITLDKAVNNIKQNTRRFAKRQMTWFRRDKDIKWFKPDQIKEINNIIEL